MAERRQRLLLAELVGAAALAGAAAALQLRHRRRVARDPEQNQLARPPSGAPLSVVSPDGTRLHAEVFGDGERTIVLAHGWTEMLSFWTYQIRALRDRGFRVVAYDLRGHGDSDPAADGDYAVTRFGEDLEAVLAAAVPDGERAIVAGHSLGAMSIAAWAERHDVEARACGAALLNTGVGNLLVDNLLVPLPLLANLLNRLAPTAFVGSRAPIPPFSTPLTHASLRWVAFGPSATPAQVAFYERMLTACPPDIRADVGLAISEIDLVSRPPPPDRARHSCWPATATG